MKTDALFATIADTLASQMEQGVRPWSRPWSLGKARTAPDFAMPHNLSGRSYRGANAFWLLMIGQQRGYESACWLTYNQAGAVGGNVKKGEKGTAVFFWSFQEKVNEETGKKERKVWAKAYTVFNIAQCEGVAIPARRILTPAERDSAADDLATATGATIRHGGDRAFYAMLPDVVVIPIREAFTDSERYYGTLFHELGHWTGHTTRCAREFGKRFGDDAYAFEELVAELTAAFVCGSLGMQTTDREDHAAYLTSWARVLRNDPKAFVTAASKAQQAADYILATSEAEDVAEAA
jgi:antirestriction protein ArdC